MKTTTLYANPSVEQPKFLFTRLLDVSQQRNMRGGRYDVVEFRVVPATPDFGSETLYSHLYRTDNAADVWARFRQTFRFDGFEIADAVGHWGKIYLVPSHWKETKYSTIQFVRQTDIDRKRCRDLEHVDEQGAMPWGIDDPDEANAWVAERLGNIEEGLLI